MILRFISDKCVGLLLRARRYKLLAFVGEMLYQGKDDNTTITMIRPFSEIHGFYKVKYPFKFQYLVTYFYPPVGKQEVDRT